MALTTHAGKGSELTWAEGDANFTGLADGSLIARELEISITDYGAVDGADIATAFAACKTALPYGGVIVIPETATQWLLSSQISTTDGIPYIIRGRGKASKITKGFNGAMISLGKLSAMEHLYLAGNGGTYTGTAVTITTGANENVSWRRLYDCDIFDTESYGVEFTAVIAGYGSVIDTCRIVPRTLTTPAIKMPTAAETNGNRTLNKVWTGSNPLADFAGSQNTNATDCQAGTPLFSSNTVKALVKANRFSDVAGATLTLDGTQCEFSGNICAAPALTLNATLTGSVVKANVFTSGVTITDNAPGSAQGNDIDLPKQSYTPTWTGGSPAIGDGTLNGVYRRQGQSVRFNILFTIGSTTNIGSGAYTFSVPYAASRNSPCGTARILDSGATFYHGVAYIASSASVLGIYRDNVAIAAGAASPMVWAAGDTMSIDGEYFI